MGIDFSVFNVRECKWCRKEFTKTACAQVYCSDACRAHGKNKTKNEQAKQQREVGFQARSVNRRRQQIKANGC